MVNRYLKVARSALLSVTASENEEGEKDRHVLSSSWRMILVTRCRS
jgi:hypothetical protein